MPSVGPRTGLHRVVVSESMSLPVPQSGLEKVNPVERVAKLAHSVGAKVLVDACQSVP